MRKSYATLLLTNNFEIKTISKLLGHTSEITTLNSYTNKHLLIEGCLEIIEDFITEVTKECMSIDNKVNDCTYVNTDGIFEKIIQDLNL